MVKYRNKMWLSCILFQIGLMCIRIYIHIQDFCGKQNTLILLQLIVAV